MKQKFLNLFLCFIFSFSFVALTKNFISAGEMTVKQPEKRVIVDFDVPVLIVQNFRVTRYKWRNHYGVDIRSYNFKTRRLCPIVSPENMIFIRRGWDYYGNGFLVFRGLESGVDEIKFIHLYSKIKFKKNDFVPKNLILGYTHLGGSARGHHLHFETWNDGKPFDPLLYFELLNIDYKFKRKSYDPILNVIGFFDFDKYFRTEFIKNTNILFTERNFIAKPVFFKYNNSIAPKRLFVYSRKNRFKRVYFICRK